ncbi:hypothetical protein BDP81DRAFT_113414 [Colletotrichum phormii]|uniref:AB hydrolase-1 domain-containing protein n=1 Tax=Colletotrichum phormii TaxID=359342 RepID=A0AAI9ZJ26_9PEZI|nr:uncharacterized protein BDP81DRAFT_113414 [Colletotrichum phormii]KAK1624306.1 hypothetical protein BDP81DRAFT_113414 [Colletotrichum phormii]
MGHSYGGLLIAHGFAAFIALMRSTRSMSCDMSYLWLSAGVVFPAPQSTQVAGGRISAPSLVPRYYLRIRTDMRPERAIDPGKRIPQKTKLDPNILAPVSSVKTRQQNAVQRSGSSGLGTRGTTRKQDGICGCAACAPSKDHDDRRRLIGDEEGSAQPAVEESPAKLPEAVDNGYATTDECSMWIL